MNRHHRLPLSTSWNRSWSEGNVVSWRTDDNDCYSWSGPSAWSYSLGTHGTLHSGSWSGGHCESVSIFV